MRRWIKAKEKPTLPPSEFSRRLSLPEDMADQIQELIDERLELGYVDVDEFVRDAIRRFIQDRRPK